MPGPRDQRQGRDEGAAVHETGATPLGPGAPPGRDAREDDGHSEQHAPLLVSPHQCGVVLTTPREQVAGDDGAKGGEGAQAEQRRHQAGDAEPRETPGARQQFHRPGQQQEADRQVDEERMEAADERLEVCQHALTPAGPSRRCRARRSGGSAALELEQVSRSWSMPSRCRIVACRSWTCTGSLHDVVAEVVGLAVRHARLDAAAGHPDGEAPRVVVAAVVRPSSACPGE